MRTKGFRYRIENFLIALVMSTFAVVCLYPVLYIIFASVSEPSRFVAYSGLLYGPLGFSMEAYKVTVKYASIWTGYANTILICAAGTAINMLATVLAAFVFSRRELVIYKAINKLAVFTMYFSGGLIPTYIVVKSIGLLDDRWSLILPVAISTYNMIILRTSIEGLPRSLEESAKIDGANDFTVLIKIIIPLVKPTLAVLALYYLVGHWNSWFNAMVYLRSKDKYPLQLVMREILIGNDLGSMQSGSVGMADRDHARRLVKYCVMTISTLPILCIYPFLQKYFVNGVMIGSVKE